MTDTYDLAALQSELTTDEGCASKAYTDTRGFITVGIGRNLTGKGLSDPEIAMLFANDIAECEANLDQHLAWWRGLPQGAQRVLLNLAFNLGIAGLLTFRHFLAAMQAQDAATACAELRDSLWWLQVGTRGQRMADRIMAAFAA